MIFSIILLIILIVGFVGFMFCTTPKIENTEYKEVEVTIIDSYYRSSYYNPASKTIVASRYEIKVMYENDEFEFDDEEIYGKYKNKIGENTKATLKIDTFTNGNKSYEIVKMK